MSQHTRKRLWRFHGGLHLPDNKEQSLTRKLKQATLPKRLILPLQQHIGEETKPLVEVGARVLKGEMIGRSKAYISAPLHAPTSGTVVSIGPEPVPHPSGLKAPCIVIEPDGKEEWAELPPPMDDYLHRDPADLRERVRWAGIVGLGGAAFPTSVKLNPGPNVRINTLVINGAECEPYITCDDLLMRTRAGKIVSGIRILKHLLEVETCLIGIEDNKPEAIAAMQAAVTEAGLKKTRVVTIPTIYPSGGEKQLIRVLTGKEVPSHSIPAQIGIVCHNVGTTAAIAEAVLEGKPLISRIVTLTGEGVAEPRNLEALIGTPVPELIEQAGGYTQAVHKLILGGPMMGIALHTDAVPLTKATNCLLAASREEAPEPAPVRPCIRCGECAKACPVSLLPQQMYWYARAKDLDKVQEYNLFDCIECGCCSHVCPAHLPLVQFYRFAKNEIWAQEEEKRKAEQARQRHEARQARLERLERERKAKLRQKKEALEKKKGGAAKEQDAKKAAIEAAMKRVAEKKAAGAQAPRNTDELTPPQQSQVDAAEARRTAPDKEGVKEE